MTTSCTSGIEISLNALGIKPGDEVIVPALTWITTASVISHYGAIPVIVDVEPDSLCISPEAIKRAISDKTKAIIMVHLYSSICKIDEIMKIAKDNNLFVIEDCAQAHGARYNNKHVGSFGDVGVFSFQQSKLLTAGEGGICITDNINLAKRLEKIVHVGDFYEKLDEPVDNDLMCKKYVLSEFQAAILYSQLKDLDKQTEMRVKNYNIIKEILSDLPSIKFQKTTEFTTTQSIFILPILLDYNFIKDNITKEQIKNDLIANGIPIGDGIGSSIYKHRLWNISPEKYKLEEINYANDIAENKLLSIFHPLLLMNKRKVVSFAKTIKSVIQKYTVTQ